MSEALSTAVLKLGEGQAQWTTIWRYGSPGGCLAMFCIGTPMKAVLIITLTQYTTNRLSLPDALLEFFTCDEFVHKFVLNQTPNELARNLVCTFFDTTDPSVRSTQTITLVLDELVHRGLNSAVKSLIEDARFSDRHGSRAVPRYVTKHDFTF